MTSRFRRKGYVRSQQMPGDYITIYAITCEQYIKVGIALNPETRMLHLQSENPFQLRLVVRNLVERCFAADAEYLAHCALEQRHHRGEWFQVTVAEARTVIGDAIKKARRRYQRAAKMRALSLHHTLASEEHSECKAAEHQA